MELYAREADLGYKKAHGNLAGIYHDKGDMKKAKFHFEVAAIWQEMKMQETTLDHWRQIRNIE
jgi:hypothetical protein